MNQSEEQRRNLLKSTEPERPVQYQKCQNVCSRVPDTEPKRPVEYQKCRHVKAGEIHYRKPSP